jgi:hypothetical protein
MDRPQQPEPVPTPPPTPSAEPGLPVEGQATGAGPESPPPAADSFRAAILGTPAPAEAQPPATSEPAQADAEPQNPAQPPSTPEPAPADAEQQNPAQPPTAVPEPTPAMTEPQVPVQPNPEPSPAEPGPQALAQPPAAEPPATTEAHVPAQPSTHAAPEPAPAQPLAAEPPAVAEPHVPAQLASTPEPAPAMAEPHIPAQPNPEPSPAEPEPQALAQPHIPAQPAPAQAPTPAATAEPHIPVQPSTHTAPEHPPTTELPIPAQAAQFPTAPPVPDAEQLTVPHLTGQPTPPAAQPQWAYSATGQPQRPTFYDPDATPTYGTRVPKPPKPPKPADPLAVALGNASLLGIGYVLLGRKVLAVTAALVTVALLIVLLSVTPTLWFEFVIVAWWVAMIAHGWVLARSRPRPNPVRTQRFVALGAVIPVLLAFGLLRFDAAGIEQDTAAARADGDCGAAVEATGKLWFGHELANAPLTVRADDTIRACNELRTADQELDSALKGDTDALAAGFGDLQGVLDDLPGHEEMVRSSMDRFLGALPVDDPCDTKAVTDWLGKEKPGGTLGDATKIVPRIAPDAIVGCADFFMEKSDWQSARQRYQQLLDQYPDHELAPKAQTGVTKATQAIELNNVRTLLTPAAGSTPAYCDKPAPYSAAKPYVPNRPNRSLVFGNDAHTSKIPPGWKATDAADAVTVICAGETEYGAPVQTCPYEAGANSLLGYVDVTFHKIAIPLRVFEVRTGKLVASFKLEIGGASCPAVLEYRSSSYVDFGPPSQVYVAASITDVQGAFRPMLVP